LHIEAIDPGSTVDFSEGETENLGTIKADGAGAEVDFTFGMVDNFGKAYFPDYALFVIYLLMIVVLLGRPQGLFGIGRT